MTSATLLVVDDLSVAFSGVTVVDRVSFEVPQGTTVGLVGESGCGKSVTALSILSLLEQPPAKLAGHVRFKGQDLLALPDKALRALRGDRVSMIFQDPMTSLNPVMTAGRQVAEVVELHQPLPWRTRRKQAWARAVEMLGLTGLSSPEERARAYPHELSGGMRQRVMIAMALANKPDLVIADEPTTALDVTVQAQILELLRRQKRELGLSMLLITHDLGVVAETCDIVNVMYAGQIVERAPVASIFATPRHPYTLGLLASMPSFLDDDNGDARRRLLAIPGAVPPPAQWPQGCRFRERCDRAIERCATDNPPLLDAGHEQVARCFNLVPLDELTQKKRRRGDASSAPGTSA